jgi:hypothetical protein
MNANDATVVRVRVPVRKLDMHEYMNRILANGRVLGFGRSYSFSKIIEDSKNQASGLASRIGAWAD